MRLPAWALHPRRFWLWLWLRLERDVMDLGPGETKGPPQYAYGRVETVYPDIRVMTEVSENPYTCCGYCSCGMVCRAAKPGLSPKMEGTAHPIRRTGGRPHPAGSRASELREGASLAHDVTLRAIAVSEIRPRLRSGHAVVSNLDYGKLPGYLKVQGGSFGHSVMLFGIKPQAGGDLVGVFDPLWPQDARGAWAKWADIDQALWGDGEHSSVKAKERPQPPEPTPVPPKPTPIPPTPPDPVPPTAPVDMDAATAFTRDWRDRAWRDYTGLEQPYVVPARFGPPLAAEGTRWSWFSRWGPAPDSGWNSGAAWDQAVWSDDRTLEPRTD